MMRESNSASGWSALVDSIVRQLHYEEGDRLFPDRETMRELEREWEQYLTMPTEVIQ